MPRTAFPCSLLLALLIGGASCGGETASSTKPSRPPLRELRSLGAPGPSKRPNIDRLEVLPEGASKVPFSRMAKYPEPGWNVPRAAQHAPVLGNEKLITFLASESGDETMSLYAFDVATGKSDVMLRASDLVTERVTNETRSREEELRRERQRDRNEGITQHLWAKKAKVLVIPHAGDVFVRDYVREPKGAVRRLTKTPDAEIDPKPCDTGERVAFVRRGELFSIDVASGKESQLTTPAPGQKKDEDGGVTHGLSDFVAQEELGEPSGFFWSPRCDRIAYLEVDERPVDKIPVLGYRAQADLMMQRYPRVGTKNPIVRAAIVDLASKRTTFVDWKGDKTERYLGRFTWAEDGRSFLVQSLTRDQKRLTLVRVDAATGATTELGSETSSAWVSFSPIRLLKKKAGDFLFTSSKSGHRHLELRNAKGELVRTLTNGDWDVEGLAGIDEEDSGGRALFVGTKDGPLQRHLYSVPLAGGEVTKLTSERGVHGVKVDDSGTTWLDVHSATDRSPRAVVVKDGRPAGELPMKSDPDIDTLALRPVEHVTIKAADGATDLSGAILKPRTITGRHPAIVFVYGGPESQLVFDMWSPKLLWQHLADRGFVVFQLDNRGAGGRGPAFAQKVHKQLGKLELEDQVAGAKWLASQPYVDGGRIGIYGHSYGGFMAALAMLDGKGTFKVGVAGSPVTDWRLYDTGYTERYMETPATNSAGYEASDLSLKAGGLTGRLLLTHAMMDENVHYAHTAKLIDALIAKDKPFDLLVLPGERHGLRAPAAKVYVPERVATYFAEHL